MEKLMGIQPDKDISFSKFNNTPFSKALVLFIRGGKSNKVEITNWRNNIKNALRFFDEVDTGDGLFYLAWI